MKSTRKSSRYAARRVGGWMVDKPKEESDDDLDIAGGAGDRPPVDKPKPDHRPPRFFI
jgi:hypothetical protein